jgi:hypothetical protein
MTEIALISVIAALLALLVIREYQNRAERRDLLDRIMCIDFREYKRYNKDGKVIAEFPGKMTDEQLAEAEKK